MGAQLTWRLDEGCGEAGVVDESVGHEEEGGDDERYLVKLT